MSLRGNMFFFLLLFFLVQQLQCLKWEDEEFAKIRGDLVTWWRESGPQPKMECTKTDHEQAIRDYTQKLDDDVGRQALNSLHTLMMKSNDTPFVGLDESLIAIRSRAARVLILSTTKHISVYDFRNPLTGHHFYEFCTGNDCASGGERQYGRDRTYFLVGCTPFPRWISNFYPRTGPVVASVHYSSDFFKRVNEIGGFFTDNFLLYKGKRRGSPSMKSWSKYFLAFSAKRA